MPDKPVTAVDPSSLAYRDRVVIITGGSKGIGAGCAAVFCRAGATVVICARNRPLGERLADELTTIGLGTCVFRPCDVTEPDQIKGLVDWTVQEYKQLDCLINNAGYAPTARSIDATERAEKETSGRGPSVSPTDGR